jgi:prepilin-type N-terminal cleavage/methylation domain-containing protein
MNSTTRSRTGTSKSAGPRRAFTLIEMMVSIGVIAVLLAVLMPALAAARAASREKLSLANVRTVGQHFAAYSNDYKTYPYRSREAVTTDVQVPFELPGILKVNWYDGGGGRAVIGTNDHFAQEWLWPGIVFSGSNKDWEENYRTWVSPGMPTEIPSPGDELDGDRHIDDMISVRYSNSFVARPELFRDGSTTDDKLLAATSPADVTYPSNKVVLWDAHLAYLRSRPPIVGFQFDAPTPMNFADGHGDVLNPTHATPAVLNPYKPHMRQMLNGTPDGVHGKDY